MGSSRSEDKILSYGDVVLRRSDLDILRGPHFISDRLIEFFFAHLSSSHPTAAGDTSSGNQNTASILLVPPSISFWLSHCPDLTSRLEAAAPLRLHDRDHVLFTVNNNTNVTLAEGGTHWSLLVYDRGDNVFVHHDSCNGMNVRYARQLYDAVKTFFGQGDGCRDPWFMSGPTPQQRNGYDCGVYVMAAARVICDWFRNGRKEEVKWFEELEAEVGDKAVAKLRLDVLGLISSFGGLERSAELTVCEQSGES